MGRVWGVDAVAKNASTSFYGNIVALAESPRKDGVLYVGTDDGLLQVSEDGGAHWRKVEEFSGVPEMTYISFITASQHDDRTLYVAFDNHKNADFHPYLLKSTDAGSSWESVKGNLPERGSVYAIAEDHVDKNLLFAGTEFGLFFTPDGGKKWIQLKSGLPTIAVRDIAIQKRENDLVLATFGRGFYVLDDYTPLRHLTSGTLASESRIFPVKDALMYIESRPYGSTGKGFLGESFFTAENPPFGATFTYYLRDALKTRKQRRQDQEKEFVKKGETPPYPTVEELRKEDQEEAPTITLTVTDESGNVVRRLNGPISKGINRVNWNLRYSPLQPVVARDQPESGRERTDPAPLAMPGKYRVTMAKRVDGVVTELKGDESFVATVLGNTTLPAADRPALVRFQRQVASLQRAVLGASQLVEDVKTRIGLLKKALTNTPAPTEKVFGDLGAFEKRTEEIYTQLRGDRTVSSRNEPTPPSIVQRVNEIVEDQWQSTGAPTRTQLDSYSIAADEFTLLLAKLRSLVQVDLKGIEASMESLGAPWTPGRIPVWEK
jgi:hypothetical protein